MIPFLFHWWLKPFKEHHLSGVIFKEIFDVFPLVQQHGRKYWLYITTTIYCFESYLRWWQNNFSLLILYIFVQVFFIFENIFGDSTFWYHGERKEYDKLFEIILRKLHSETLKFSKTHSVKGFHYFLALQRWLGMYLKTPFMRFWIYCIVL